jgi:hypothetical protein
MECRLRSRNHVSAVDTHVRGLTETNVGGGELSMRSQIVRGSFKVVFIEYTPTGVTVHHEAALEGGGAVYGHKAMGRFFVATSCGRWRRSRPSSFLHDLMSRAHCTTVAAR